MKCQLMLSQIRGSYESHKDFRICSTCYIKMKEYFLSKSPVSYRSTACKSGSLSETQGVEKQLSFLDKEKYVENLEKTEQYLLLMLPSYGIGEFTAFISAFWRPFENGLFPFSCNKSRVTEKKMMLDYGNHHQCSTSILATIPE